MAFFFFAPNTWQVTTFLNPLDTLIPKIQFSFFFCRILCSVHLRAQGSVSVVFLGGRQFLFLGGGLARGLYRPPPPPANETPPTPGGWGTTWCWGEGTGVQHAKSNAKGWASDDCSHTSSAGPTTSLMRRHVISHTSKMCFSSTCRPGVHAYR